MKKKKMDFFQSDSLSLENPLPTCASSAFPGNFFCLCPQEFLSSQSHLSSSRPAPPVEFATHSALSSRFHPC